MTQQCDEILERMPPLAAGAIDTPADFAAHLEGCQSCRINWQIIQAGARLGAPAAAGLDTDRLARSVIARLGQARQADRRRRGLAWGTVMAAAAALFLVVYTGRRNDTGPAPVSTASAIGADASFTVPVSGLDDLDATELQKVYDQLDGALSGGASVAAPHIEELSPDEMEQVLNSLEG